MGCSNGKMVQVKPEGELLQKHKKVQHVKGLDILNGSSISSAGGGERPSKSATSTASKQSHDSGYSGNDLEEDDGIDEYANIITENSEGAIVEKIESSFQAPELDLCLSGTPAPRNLSAKDKARLDEQRILENLRNEGLIATPKSKAKNGLAFEVVEATTMLRRAVPSRLAKLEKKKKKKTKEEIAEKLAMAEQRRKDAENEKLEKINAVAAKSDISQVQQDMVKQHQELLECTTKKVDSVVEKKEQRLQEIKDKLKAREEHAAKVRLRKKLHIPVEEEEEYELNNNETKRDDRLKLEIDSQDNIAVGETKESQQAPTSNTEIVSKRIAASDT
ncbi:uncharacterized protein [Watersipora subatra]|uniref:uncharacterized protein n=1 Tax=Watersipora subatra TaxID=2589382 RepID=UPI00355B3E2B